MFVKIYIFIKFKNTVTSCSQQKSDFTWIFTLQCSPTNCRERASRFAAQAMTSHVNKEAQT